MVKRMHWRRKAAVNVVTVSLLLATLAMISGCGSSSASPASPQANNSPSQNPTTPPTPAPPTPAPPTPTPGPANGPSVTITAAATTIAQGGSTTVSWSSTNATSLEIQPDIGLDAEPVPLIGNITVGPLQQTTTYVSTATDKD